MASGINPTLANAPTFVVSDGLFEMTVPQKKEPKPIAFEMKVNINYEATCDPVRNGAAAEEKCKDDMKDELVNLLGAPSDMIQVTGVKPR